MSCVFDSIGRQFSHYFFRSEYFSRCLMASVAFNIRSVIFRALKTVGNLMDARALKIRLRGNYHNYAMKND